jgi:hypothetical protein
VSATTCSPSPQCAYRTPNLCQAALHQCGPDQVRGAKGRDGALADPHQRRHRPDRNERSRKALDEDSRPSEFSSGVGVDFGGGECVKRAGRKDDVCARERCGCLFHPTALSWPQWRRKGRSLPSKAWKNLVNNCGRRARILNRAAMVAFHVASATVACSAFSRVI